ncbi:hypothetical protein [Saliphagus infecundisoli]|uniref:Homing endonuclease LAGLIDADG domain-containing protein n=1 Tax=Saliphagus infecundisoli TaxID=1849069 RepID=A0ABD5QC52_9EURY|nr:hypothetical protein [Saliphagus infecundisoli]
MVTGALMGDGSLEGRERTKLRIETTTREFALWLHEQFDMAAGSLRRFPQDGPNQDVYRVSTIAHPEFNPYRDWYRDGEKRIPDPVQLRPASARVFVACDSSLSFGGNDHPRLTFSAVDDGYREDLVRTLSRLEIGTTPRVGSRRVSIDVPDVPRLLEWIGDPVPGVEHKWATSQSDYDRLRDRQ